MGVDCPSMIVLGTLEDMAKGNVHQDCSHFSGQPASTELSSLRAEGASGQTYTWFVCLAWPLLTVSL